MRSIRKATMKRVGYIYSKIWDEENIKMAIRKASLGKRSQKRVSRILNNDSFYAHEISQMLINKTYKPSPHIAKTIMDGANKKERTICKPIFYPDQIIHWALMLQLQPVIMKGMYEYSCGSVPKRGTSYAQGFLRNALDNDRKNTKYCLKMDISKFYPSIDNEILKSMFRRKIKDSDCLWLIDTIIDFNKGQPIGYYTSQWFSNFFLEELDHIIKEKLKVAYYVRYVDDLVILGANKKALHKVRLEIDSYLKTLKLSMKPNWQIFPIKHRDIDFLGLRFFRDRTILRKRNSLRMRRRAKRTGDKMKINHHDASAIISYWGWIKRSDSFWFYNNYIKPMISIKRCRKVVSNYGKQYT
ncbi:RNA-directed DNA polymerase [Candidatus Nomurabacteria bacterium]|nr:RNA-directed DNA polymerase [Candidatus Nomurabacteria bacterium]